MTALGATLAYFINYGFYHLSGQIVWRFPIAFQIVFALSTLVSLPFLPESPRFLYAQGRLSEADEVMAALKGQDVNSEAVQYERAAILAAIADEDLAGEYSLKNIFFDRSGQQIPRRMALVVVIQVIQELSGTNIIVNYASNILINVGLSHDLSLLLGGVVTLAFWLGSLIGIYLIEKVGRKILLYSGTIPMFVGYIIYTLMVKDGRTDELWVAFAFLALIIASFGWSWLSVAWVLGPELVPVRYRHIGGALNALSNWTFVFVTVTKVKIGPICLANLGWRFYIIFIVFTALQIPIVYFFIPETKGLSLEEIDLLFVKSPDHEQNAGKHDDHEVKEVENSITVTQITS
ncbi:MFS general substrate transporter [Xylaria longipes]|nr:MFS general substrate transporter [Xylaria longipes]